MTELQAAALGLVQGLTEFLPVSSSGHLVLGQHLLAIKEPTLLFDIAVHVGTLLAVLVVFRDDLLGMIRGLWERSEQGQRGRRLIMLVVVGSIPTALIGLLLKDYFEAMFSSLLAVGVSLMVTGGLLYLTRLAPKESRDLKRTGPGRALIIGAIQGMAITPGISRSGSTISIALLLGVDRKLAAHYSFLLSIPAILGALALQVKDLEPTTVLPWTTMLVGGTVAALSGYGALRLLLKLVQGGRLHWFAPYCWALGAAALIWYFAA